MDLRLPPLPKVALKAIQERVDFESNVKILIEKKIQFEYITPLRLKMGSFHFWPGSGTWRDYCSIAKGKGIESFLANYNYSEPV